MSKQAKTASKPAHFLASERTNALAEPLQQGQFVSVREAAAILKMSEISIRRFLTQKKLRRYKVGSRTLVKISEVLGLIHEVK